MTNTVTLHAIATDIVGHYGNAAKSLVAAYRGASKRALANGGKRYAKLVEQLPQPIVGDAAKARIVAAERRFADVVGQGVERTVDGYQRAIEVVSGQSLKGIEAFAERTDWAKDMFVVDAARRIQLPAARLSLEIASRIDEAAGALSARAVEAVAQAVVKPTAKRATKTARRATKRVRRAA